MKRRAVAFALLSCTLAFLGAQAPTIAGLKGKKIEINLWTHEDPNRMPIEKQFIAEFMAANPGVTVNYSTYPSGKIAEKLSVAFAAGQGPDIFNVAIGNAVTYLDNGRIAPIDYKAIGLANAAALEAEYLPGTLGAVTRDGMIYGLPLELTNLCLYINKKMFRDAGIDPEKNYPKTWEDVMALSEKLVKRNGQIITRRGFDFRYDAYPSTFVPMVEQLGGQFVSADGKNAIIGDEAWLKVLNYVKDFGPAGKNLGSPTYTAARTQFDLNKDEIAMSISGLYQEARMEKANPDFWKSKDWMVVPFPQWKDAKKKVTANYSGHYYMVNAESSKLVQQASWALVGYMLSHGEAYLDKVALLPPRASLVGSKTYTSMPYSDVFAKDFDAAKIVYIGKGASNLTALLKEAFEGVMVGGVDPQAALAKLRKGALAVLAEAD